MKFSQLCKTYRQVFSRPPVGNTAAALHLLKVAHPYPHGVDNQKKPRKTAATYLAMKH